MGRGKTAWIVGLDGEITDTGFFKSHSQVIKDKEYYKRKEEKRERNSS